jgi:hypothetical protein
MESTIRPAFKYKARFTKRPRVRRRGDRLIYFEKDVKFTLVLKRKVYNYPSGLYFPRGTRLSVKMDYALNVAGEIHYRVHCIWVKHWWRERYICVAAHNGGEPTGRTANELAENIILNLQSLNFAYDIAELRRLRTEDMPW